MNESESAGEEGLMGGEAVRLAVSKAEDLIGATLELISHVGAARWCAYLVPHAEESWRVAVATGDGAPELGAVLSRFEVEELLGTSEVPENRGSALPGLIYRHVHFPHPEHGYEPDEHGHPPTGLLCAAPNADHPVERHEALAATMHIVFDHLTSLVNHHANHAGRAERAVAAASGQGMRVVADPVTGLLAREVVLARLGDEVARAKRYGGGLSVLLCDLDQLKELAAAAGGEARDAILAAVGGALRAGLRQIDCAGRYGEHSLLLVLPETGPAESLRAATRLAHFVAEAVAAVDLGDLPRGGSGQSTGGRAATDAFVEPAAEAVVAPADLSADAVTAAPAGDVPAVVLRIGASTYPSPARTAEELVSQAQAALGSVRESGGEAWLGHALDLLNEPPVGGFRCVCRRCGKVFQVPDRAQQRARRFCSHECYTLARRSGGQERDDQIRELRREGQSLRAIARRFGLSAERVRQILETAPV